ncbi:duf647 domain-containing protein [Moniliophthora roreri MCA 2997]|uniref:Duf647 domain-containing protein n=2 Tax=Moniliophthora roreri TaxID=221103 RepID=V2X4G8_MONRO|nr:duf647 domain-containing protein [Moniliophthora roreri MCA 2997]
MKILEKSENGKVTSTIVSAGRVSTYSEPNVVKAASHGSLLNFLRKVFLPTGYPHTVSPDYTRYQVLNALQEFCSSLAGMLSSRATLEGYGVGNASASATNALLLSVLQDIFGRLMTIAAAYHFGSSLMPEAKTYRFVADLLIDAAIILDTLAPLLVSLPALASLTNTVPIPFRIYIIFFSSGFRALCGIAAGGSKTAITLHFATPVDGTLGNVGDLNAKGASSETVLSLMGMTLGTIIVPYLTSPLSTYIALVILVAAHLSINFAAVQGIVFRTLNRQRACLGWMIYRDYESARSTSGDAKNLPLHLTPSAIAKYERIFHRPDRIYDPLSGSNIGRCTIGSSLGSVFTRAKTPEKVIDIFTKEKYILWFDPACLVTLGVPNSSRNLIARPHLHIILKDGHKPGDQLKAWLHATELARILEKQNQNYRRELRDQVQRALGDGGNGQVTLATLEEPQAPEALIASTHQLIDENYSHFIQMMHKTGWATTNEKGALELVVALLTIPPESVIIDILDDEDGELKKEK